MGKYFCAVCRNEITIEDCYNCFSCGWDSDPVQEADPNYRGGANKMSLNEAKAEWQKIHAPLADNTHSPARKRELVTA